jgi:hypothetical protein
MLVSRRDNHLRPSTRLFKRAFAPVNAMRQVV